MFSIFSLFLALHLFLLVSSAPTPATQDTTSSAAASSYWLSSITRQGTVAYRDGDFQVFRNVKDFGAVGDGTSSTFKIYLVADIFLGSADDTVAINAAITAGGRCGQGCDSSTITPALIYFPPGTYAISAPLIQLYYTQFVGDAVTLPTIKATAGFAGIALIDSDPYADGGV